MSQTVATLVASPQVDPQDAPASVSFGRRPTGTPGEWIAGFAFGLVCIAAALVFIVVIAVVALAGAARRRAESVDWPTRVPTQRRPPSSGVRPRSYALVTA